MARRWRHRFWLAHWWRRRSLRARLTLITSAGLALALAAAGVLLVNALRLSLIRGLDDSARQGAVEVAALIAQDRLPDPVPVGSGTLTIQVLDAQGRITDVSPGADRLVPLLSPAQAAAVAGSGRAGCCPGRPGAARIAAGGGGARERRPGGGGRGLLRPARQHRRGDPALLIGMPLLFGLLTLATWLVTGYTLRPIAELRRGAAEVTPDRRPPGPARPARPGRGAVAGRHAERHAGPAGRSAAAAARSGLRHRARAAQSIASIRAQLEVAIDHPDGLDWTETARDVHADTLRLARLAEDLLLLARLDEQRIRRSPVDLAAVCTSVAARYTAARVPVTADAPAPVMVSGDPDALSRLVVNLLDNAVRHAAGQVSVSVRACSGAARLEVDRRRSRHPRRGPGTGLRPVLPAGRRAQPGGRGRGGGTVLAWTGLAVDGLAWTGPAWGWPSCGPPPRRTAARSRWGTPGRACAPPSGCPHSLRWDQPPGRQEAMRLTSMTTADGVCEQDFILGDIPGVLWSPAGATGPRPLVLLGHGGGQHKRGPGTVARARQFVTSCGFAAAAIDMPGSGDRPRTEEDERFWDTLRARRAAGEPVAAEVARHFAELAGRAVPEWQAVLDALARAGARPGRAGRSGTGACRWAPWSACRWPRPSRGSAPPCSAWRAAVTATPWPRRRAGSASRSSSCCSGTTS